MDKIKNISKSEILVLKDQLLYHAQQIASKTLVQNEHVSITLFSFDKDEEISTHESNGDAFVTILDGIAQITIDNIKYVLHENESIIMPAKHSHAIYAIEKFKMLLVIIF
jgi:Uncharacterized conserved protein, contains double-stranded beta-helix domain